MPIPPDWIGKSISVAVSLAWSDSAVYASPINLIVSGNNATLNVYNSNRYYPTFSRIIATTRVVGTFGDIMTSIADTPVIFQIYNNSGYTITPINGVVAITVMLVQ